MREIKFRGYFNGIERVNEKHGWVYGHLTKNAIGTTVMITPDAFAVVEPGGV